MKRKSLILKFGTLLALSIGFNSYVWSDGFQTAEDVKNDIQPGMLGDSTSATLAATSATSVFGIGVVAVFSNTTCTTSIISNRTNSPYFATTALAIPTVASGNSVPIGSNMLYQQVWNVLASEARSNTPTSVTGIRIATVNALNGLATPSTGFCNGTATNCTGTTPTLTSGTLILNSSNASCLPVTCSTTTKTCTITGTPALHI